MGSNERSGDPGARRCPFCGQVIGPVIEAEMAQTTGWKRREFVRYGLTGEAAVPAGTETGEAAVPAGTEWERRRPARGARFESDVAVPVLQALMTGTTAGLAGGGLAAALGMRAPWATGLALAGVAWGGAWVWLLRDSRRLLWEVERVMGVDLDRDRVIGGPGDEETRGQGDKEHLVLVHKAKQRGDGRLRAAFEEFVRGCERDTSQNYWEQVQRLDRERYMEWRDALIRLGWAKWRGARNQGWELAYPAGEVIEGMFGNGKTSRAPK